MDLRMLLDGVLRRKKVYIYSFADLLLLHSRSAETAVLF